MSALYWALIFPTEFEKNANSPQTSLPHLRAKTENKILNGRYLWKQGEEGKEVHKGERERGKGAESTRHHKTRSIHLPPGSGREKENDV